MKIGDRVKHIINGFTGIATGRTEYMNGCRQFLVQPEKLDKEGKRIEGERYDEQFLKVETHGVFADPFAKATAPRAGGPDRRTRATSL